ncbi:4Fe-4S binding protein [Thermoanaerobacterium sp. CMT5567-10]|uniref:4Fe-4S binding protein n=1 Tax=Thermoanaerobacterium sp. CMT5567-10 TaxID=3061989 RepID=UPI0026DF2072|nr:4Fe-4S binding protein [Thermoanaerobacterium sp. CMT5567-10]WKV08293.1 4Fe-4S binding protein [Thermoanaerobacterium sp. CMT5567-10]
MKRRIMLMQVIRFFVQLFSLILFPISFAILFSQIKSLYLAFIGKESFNWNQNFILLIVTVIVTIFLGRLFCGWICAFGTVTEWINVLFRKFFKIKLEIPKKIDKVLKGLKYLVLLYLILYIWTFGYKQFADPWDAFDNLISLNFNISFYLASFVFLVLIILLSIFVSRPYCRYFCPLGAVFNIVSRLRLVFVKKKEKNCGQCRICEVSCPMGIETENVEKYKGECVSCLKCVEVCPRYNMQLNLGNQFVNQKYTRRLTVAGLFAVFAAFSALIFLPSVKKIDTAKYSVKPSMATEQASLPSPIEANSQNSATANTTESSKSTSKIYKDGTYTGEGFGYRPGLVVEVTIKNDKITKIEIVSNNETPRFAQLPFEIIPQEIIQNQSTNVDAVSGATKTSNGIIMAVEDALNKAKIENSQGTQD